MSMILSNPIQLQVIVTSSSQVAHGIHLLEMEAPQIGTIARPGQFAMLKCGGGAFLRRSLSIHRVSKDKSKISFLFTIVGKGTDWISSLKNSDIIDILGPLGNGFSLNKLSKEILLVAGGLGLLPSCSSPRTRWQKVCGSIWPTARPATSGLIRIYCLVISICWSSPRMARAAREGWLPSASRISCRRWTRFSPADRCPCTAAW